MKYLLVAGCSHSHGSETLGEGDFSAESINYAYGSYIAKALNSEYINIAQPGISNSEITFNVLNWCVHNTDKIKDTLILVGWTGLGRMRINTYDILGEQSKTITLGSMYAYIQGKETNPYFTSLFKKIDPKNTFFKIYLEYFAESPDSCWKEMMCKLALDLFLQKKTATYLTFLTQQHNMSSNIFDFVKTLVSKNNNLFEYSIIDKCSNTKTRTNQHHMKIEGHKKAAMLLLDELIKRKIINSVAFPNTLLYK